MSKITVMAYEQPQDDHGYKYLIKKDYRLGFGAYKTDAGFKFWLKSRNVQLRRTEVINHPLKGIIKIYNVIGEVVEESFWHLSDIPLDAVRFTGLSNGSLVDCYYLHTDNGSIIYRPNPNAKEVYNPMPIDEHIEFQRRLG